MSGNDESHSLRGPVDRSALITIRDIFVELEPLATAALDDFLDPRGLEVRYSDGLLSAERSRIDVEWTTRDDYKFHYTDPTGVDFRCDCHPHDGYYDHVPALKHFHPPPDASVDPHLVEESCIEQSLAELVTRAVIKLWRVAYHADSLAPLNSGSNPP